MTTTQIARFALGCFWQPEMYFSKLPGVLATRVGYAGGTTENPSYTDLGDHTETLEVTFDPAQVSYEELLEHFWRQHDPTVEFKPQYQSAIFPADTAQQQAATASKEAEQTRQRKPIVTRIEPGVRFWQAEEYHQNYLRKCGVAS
jgi:peptide-methionine (S)-S-oxide reductase